MAIAQKHLATLHQRKRIPEHSLPLTIVETEQVTTHTARGVVRVGRELLKWTLDVPSEPTHPGVSVFVPGFGGFYATSRAPRRALAAEGIASVSYGPVRRCDSPAIQQLLHAADAHVATIEAVTDALEHNDDAKAALRYSNANPNSLWLVLHSMAGESGVKFAEDHPEKVEGVTHLSTVGLGSPTVPQLLARLPKGIIPGIQHELIPYIRAGAINPTVASLLQAINYYTSNPIRTAGEAYSCLRADTRASIAALGQAGVQNDYLGAEFDCLVQPHQSVAPIFNRFARAPRAGHLFPQLKANFMARQVRLLMTGRDFDFAQNLPSSSLAVDNSWMSVL